MHLIDTLISNYDLSDTIHEIVIAGLLFLLILPKRIKVRL